MDLNAARYALNH